MREEYERWRRRRETGSDVPPLRTRDLLLIGIGIVVFQLFIESLLALERSHGRGTALLLAAAFVALLWGVGQWRGGDTRRALHAMVYGAALLGGAYWASYTLLKIPGVSPLSSLDGTLKGEGLIIPFWVVCFCGYSRSLTPALTLSGILLGVTLLLLSSLAGVAASQGVLIALSAWTFAAFIYRISPIEPNIDPSFDLFIHLVACAFFAALGALFGLLAGFLGHWAAEAILGLSGPPFNGKMFWTLNVAIGGGVGAAAGYLFRVARDYLRPSPNPADE